MQLLKQLKMIDKATDKIRRMSESFFHNNKYQYKEERMLVARKVIKDGFKFNSADEEMPKNYHKSVDMGGNGDYTEYSYMITRVRVDARHSFFFV